MTRTTSLLFASALAILPISAFAQAAGDDSKPAAPAAAAPATNAASATSPASAAAAPAEKVTTKSHHHHVKTMKVNHAKQAAPTGVEAKAPEQQTK